MSRSDDEIRALIDAATPGPWEIYRYRTGGGRIHISGDDGRPRTLIADMDADLDSVATVYNEGDREFMFAARDLVPALLERAQRAEARLAECELAIRWVYRFAGGDGHAIGPHLAVNVRDRLAPLAAEGWGQA
jgi:hypothetical protein